MATSTRELLPLEGSTSAVWKHFGFPAKEGKILIDKKKRTEVHCKICGKIVKYNGSTTNLRFHLKEYHKSVFSSLPSTADHGSTSKTPLPKNQVTLSQAISAGQPIPTSSVKWNKLTDGIMYFILKDIQPLDTIDDVGFRHMIKEFEPRYTPPQEKQ